MADAQKLSGLNPLAYVGVEPSAPPQVVLQTRQPTTNDYANFNIGTWWLMVVEQEVWILISKVGGIATWIQLYPGGGAGGADAFITDSGTANQAGGEIDVVGGLNINTAGAGKIVTVNLDNSVAIPNTLSVASTTTLLDTLSATDIIASDDISSAGTITANQGVVVTAAGIDSTGNTRLRDLSTGVMQTNSSGNVSSTAGNNGQVLIGATGGAPAWANITSTGGTITITNGANSINLEQTGGTTADISFLAQYDAQEELWTSAQADGTKEPGSVNPPTVVFNNGGGYDPGDGAGTGMSFTAPVTGVYVFYYYFQFATNDTNVSYLRPTTPSYKYFFPPLKPPSFVKQNYGYITADLTLGDVVTFPITFSRVASSSNFKINSVIASPDDAYVSFIYGHILA